MAKPATSSPQIDGNNRNNEEQQATSDDVNKQMVDIIRRLLA
jgi:hypothetical protein